MVNHKAIAILGDAGSGKTTLVKSLVNHGFDFQDHVAYIPTAGYTKTMCTLPHIDTEFELYDYAGHELHSFNNSSLNGIDAAVLVCDGGSRLSRRSLKLWNRLLPTSVPVLTVQTKSDIVQKYRSSNSIQVSSKTGHNIDLLRACLHLVSSN
jgi:GTPase SAR1 family protein